MVIIKIFFAPFFVFISFVILTFILKIHLVWSSVDIPLHFMGGMAIAHSAWVFLSLLEKHKLMYLTLKTVQLLFITSLVALAAVGWELAEFVVGHGLNVVLFQGTYVDTLSDLAIGIFGGVIAGTYFIFRVKG